MARLAPVLLPTGTNCRQPDKLNLMGIWFNSLC